MKADVITCGKFCCNKKLEVLKKHETYIIDEECPRIGQKYTVPPAQWELSHVFDQQGSQKSLSPKDWLGVVVLAEEILDDCNASGEAKRGEDEYNDPEVPEALDHDGVVLCRSV